LNSNFTIDRFCLPKEGTYFNIWAIQGALVQSLSLPSARYILNEATRVAKESPG